MNKFIAFLMNSIFLNKTLKIINNIPIILTNKI